MLRNERSIKRLQDVMKALRDSHLGLKAWDTEGDRLAYEKMDNLLSKLRVHFVQGVRAHTVIPDPLEIRELLPGAKRFYWDSSEYERKEIKIQDV